MLIDMDVVGVMMPSSGNSPVLLLRDPHEPSRWLAIWIGRSEATEIVAAQNALPAPRPGSIELLTDIIATLQSRVQRVEITALRDNTYYADLVLNNEVRVSARPSDAIAVAIRTNVAVSVDKEVLDEVGLTVGSDADGSAPASALANEQDLAGFRSFLEDVHADDFLEPPPQPGAHPPEGLDG